MWVVPVHTVRAGRGLGKQSLRELRLQKGEGQGAVRRAETYMEIGEVHGLLADVV